MHLRQVTLDDKYLTEPSRVYLTGIQALVRLPLVQRQIDLQAGLNTGGFISGYRGSPLGGYDNALWRAKNYLVGSNIHFQPGLNEDLAATAVWGSQQVGLAPGNTVQGVFGIWYGKGPGADRSLDVLKHANAAGSSRFGGVLAIAGDDHGCQSSTLPHQSEHVFESAMMPVLNPANVAEYLEYGLFGFALSRFSGCWIGFKAISETVESSASIDTDLSRLKFQIPEDFPMPPLGLGIRWPDPALERERRLHGPKMDAVYAFARANAIDRIVVSGPDDRLGILTTGKAYLDVRQALAVLGLNDALLARFGIRLYKVGMTWPLEPSRAIEFATSLKTVLVVEEKRSFVEEQFTRIIFNMDASLRPRVAGKVDETGAPLLPSIGELTPMMVARSILHCLRRLGPVDAGLEAKLSELLVRENSQKKAEVVRTPFFCSGCPHNSSTRVPAGSRAMAGIGCHSMAMSIPERNTATLTHMGGEGTNWIGQAPFTTERHVFQNLGDGTYTHSGLLAIRAACAARVNITYKILFNDAVAMTGGQPAEGHFTVPQITRQLESEGVRRVVVVADDPDKYDDQSIFAPSVKIYHRDELDAVQQELREIPGVTALIYDQVCAAEKRRRRKRGKEPALPSRVVINDLVCEGCGDCSTQSNCISITPIETELGRKREIDQSSCNFDMSCLKGFCPSFVTIEGATRRFARAPDLDHMLASLPMPKPDLEGAYKILVTGIGGTGVITIGALLGMAAHLEGIECSVLDFTGMSQKNGAVTSHVQLGRASSDLHAVRIEPGGANLVLGGDLVVTVGSESISCFSSGKTRAIVNSHLVPTAAFLRYQDERWNVDGMHRQLAAVTAQDGLEFIDATRMAAVLMGDAMASNILVLGYAFQRGLIPISFDAIDRAIELNAVAVDWNKRAFSCGRLAAYDGGLLNRIAGTGDVRRSKPTSFEETIKDRADHLTAYQNKAYADQYLGFVAFVAETEKSRCGGSALAEAVAVNLYKLMAYKDEYEVARLYTDGRFLEKLRSTFEGDFTLAFHLAPPLLPGVDKRTGQARKRKFGSWMLPLMRILASLRFLRGTAADIFGHTSERRMERGLVEDYKNTVVLLCNELNSGNCEIAVQIASLPDQIRGYGHIKMSNVEKVRIKESQLLARYRAAGFSQAAE